MTSIDRGTRLSRRGCPLGITRRRSFALGLGLLAVLPACGGDPDELSTVPASGTVTFQGKPLETGTIQFVPKKGRVASGKITGGRFTLTTYKDGDGAIPGQHAVAVVSLKEKPPAQAGAEPETSPAFDKKYFSPEMSGLTADIPAGGKTDIQIDVK